MHLLLVGNQNSRRRELLNRLMATVKTGLEIGGFQTVKDDENLMGTAPVYIFPWGGLQHRCEDNLVGTCTKQKAVKFPSAFERYAYLVEDVPAQAICVMDELGPMESCSPRFCSAVLARLESDAPILASVRDIDSPFLNAVRDHDKVKCFVIDADWDEEIYEQALAFWQQQISEWEGNGTGKIAVGQQEMSLNAALAIPTAPGLSAIVGGGGKTSLMYRLSAEYAAQERPVIISTTTRIGVPPPAQARLLLAENIQDEQTLTQPGQVLCIAADGREGKLYFPGPAIWKRCLAAAERVFAECDGSRRLPIKLPAAHEPVIPLAADSVIAVAGLSALGRPLQEICFRYELAQQLFGVQPQQALTPQLLARILTHESGQFKTVGSQERFRIFLNQADDAPRRALGLETAAHIRNLMPGCRVVVGRLQPQLEIVAVL